MDSFRDNSQHILDNLDWANRNRPHRNYGPQIRPRDSYYITPSQKATFLAHTCCPIPEHQPQTYGAWEADHRRFLHRVGPHRARSLFEDELGDALVSLCNASNFCWESIGLCRQEIDAHQRQITILVVLSSIYADPSDLEIHRAETLCDGIQGLLNLIHLDDVHAQVISAYGSVRYPYNAQLNPATMFDPLYPGVSIGATGMPKSATLSGFVRIQESVRTEPRVFGLSSNHAASLGCLSASDCVELTSPSTDDYNKATELMERAIRSEDGEIAKREEKKKEYLLVGGTWTSYLEKDLGESKAIKNRKREHLEELQGFWKRQNSVGRITLSFGITQPAPSQPLSDWALIQLTDTRLSNRDFGSSKASNFGAEKAWDMAVEICSKYDVPRIVPGAPKPGLMSFCSPDEEHPLSVAEVKDLCNAEEPTYVYLHGRTTTFGVGLLHDVRDRVCTRYNTSDGEVCMFSSELVVLEIPVPFTRWMGPFSTGGDSGAPVRTADGQLVGVLFGSNEKEGVGRPSFHVSMAEDIVTQIKAATGAYKVEFTGY